MKVHDVIRYFAVLANLPRFAPDRLNVARLRLDGVIDINFEYGANNDVLHLYSEIARASDNCIHQFEQLMGANLFLARSDGTTIAINPRTRQFKSCVKLDPQFLNGTRLIAEAEKMANAVADLRKELKNLTGQSNSE